MADHSLLDRFKPQSDSRSSSPEPEGVIDDFLAFGWLRGARDRATCLELRRKTGNITAIGYAWLQKLDFDPSKGITLWFPGEKIMIAGRNLNAEVRSNVRLFEGLARHKVPWVQESPELGRFTDDPKTVLVERIHGLTSS